MAIPTPRAQETGREMQGMPIPMEIQPDRVKRLHRIYNTLKSRGDDEGLAEFMDYMKSKDSIIGFDQEGNPILEAKKGGTIKMQAGGTTPDIGKATHEAITEQAGISPTTGQAQPSTLPTGTTISATPLTVQTGEIATQPTIGTTPTTPTTEASTTNLNVSIPQTPNISTYTGYTTPNTPTAQAITGSLSSQAIIGNIQGAVSQQAEVAAAQGTVDPKATVKYQIEQLLGSIGTGANLPAWASPAVTKVNAIMAQRGLGQSSMAAAAITQAVMESAIPIAVADARTYSAIDLANLNNQQQAVLQNAMTYAAMDKANLDARMSSAVNNAKNFLSIDLSNLTNNQKTNELDYQGKLQRLFNDQAATNASLQFNAKSQNEIDQFFSELGVQTENANKNRIAAQNQFNADQKNANSRFVTSVQDSRDKFNANMQMQIDQSNITWRRNINTANTTLSNENNRLNAMNLLQINQSALNNLWQRYRDEASWFMQSAESAKQRAHQVAMFAQESTFDKAMYEQQTKDITMSEMGKAVLNGIFNLF
jgi:hypothetical protein|tara:strand:- start:1573 stop:3183 length:1611 start_codon:yes stop_codon:yes gene_type:complete